MLTECAANNCSPAEPACQTCTDLLALAATRPNTPPAPPTAGAYRQAPPTAGACLYSEESEFLLAWLPGEKSSALLPAPVLPPPDTIWLYERPNLLRNSCPLRKLRPQDGIGDPRISEPLEERAAPERTESGDISASEQSSDASEDLLGHNPPISNCKCSIEKGYGVLHAEGY